MITAKLSISEIQYRVLKPDTVENSGRANMRLLKEDFGFYIYIEAPDTGSLKATLASLARLLHVISDMEGLING